MLPPNYPIVILSSDRLNNSYSSAAQSIAKQLSKQHKVYFINRPYSFKDVIKSIFGETLGDANPWKLLFGKIEISAFKNYDSLISVHVPATLPINWIKSRKVYDILQNYNDCITFKTIQKIVKVEGIRQYVFLTSYNPYYLPFFKKRSGIQPDLNIYQSRDDISQDLYTRKHGTPLENRAVKKADFVLVTSNVLKKKLEKINPKTYALNNGVNYDMFEEAAKGNFAKPVELEKISGKIIGYTGNLDENRVDYQLLKFIAHHFPDHTLLLVGPITCSYYYDEGLDKLPNILSIGARDISELPQYLAYMDVAIIPFLKNGFTESVYPLKLNEYLATGSDIVSTNFSEDVRSFSDVIEIADTYEEFVEKIDQLLAREINQAEIAKRLSVAKENSWENRVNELHQLVEKYFQETTND